MKYVIYNFINIILCLIKFKMSILLQDQGNPPQYTDTIIYVNIIDADDQNPKFYDERYTATLHDHTAKVIDIIFLNKITIYYSNTYTWLLL